MSARTRTPPRLITLILLASLSVMSLNMFLPSLPNIAAEFEADYTLVTLSIAGYAGLTAALQLILGPLSDRYGRRPVLLSGVGIFLLASLGCAHATDIHTFLAFRVLQCAITVGWIVSLAAIRDTSGEREAASLIGYVSMAMAIGPMLGPMIGGTLDQLAGWRASFWAYAGAGLVVFLLCWIDFGETNRSPSETLAKQFRTYPELFRSRRFWGYAVCMASSISAFYAFLAGAPLVAGSVFGISTATLGFYMGSITAGYVFGSFLSGRYATRFGLIPMIMTGRLVACCGLTLGLILLMAGIVDIVLFFAATACVGIGNGLTTPNASSGIMSVRPKLAGSASGLSGAMTVGGGGLIAFVTGAVMTPANAPYALLGMMLFASAVALVAALYVAWVDRQEAASAQAAD